MDVIVVATHLDGWRIQSPTGTADIFMEERFNSIVNKLLTMLCAEDDMPKDLC